MLAKHSIVLTDVVTKLNISANLTKVHPMIGCFVSNKLNTIFEYLWNIATNCGYSF